MTRPVALDTTIYDQDCRACQRLASFLDKVKSAHPTYFCKPVPPFGDQLAWLLIVGLAPGMHGANASGRPFTGDYAGLLLYQTLFDYGWATHPTSLSATDEMKLTGARLTNAVKCLPPENKPTPAEAKKCNGYLANEIKAMPAGGAIVALGRIAHDSVLRALGERAAAHPFGHAAKHSVGPADKGLVLFDSYHCSRYNTNTGRLTAKMFRDVFEAIKTHRDGQQQRQ